MPTGHEISHKEVRNTRNIIGSHQVSGGRTGSARTNLTSNVSRGLFSCYYPPDGGDYRPVIECAEISTLNVQNRLDGMVDSF